MDFTGYKNNTFKERFETKFMPVTESGCWIWLYGITVKGYGIAHNEGRAFGAHRASWSIYRGKIPKGKHVLHRCDVRSCVNPDHLFIGTNKDNVADRHSKGRTARGESKSSIFKESDILSIRADSRTHKEIAKTYGCAKSTITNIKLKNRWPHV